MVISVLITCAIQQYGLRFLVGSSLAHLTLNFCLGFMLGESTSVRISILDISPRIRSVVTMISVLSTVLEQSANTAWVNHTYQASL